MKRIALWIGTVLLWGSLLPPAGADSGFLTGLSLTAVPLGGLEAKFTIQETTLSSTTYNLVSSTTSFGGVLDFGDGSAATTAVLHIDQSKKKGKGREHTLTAMVNHTYPAPGKYTATLTHCCLAELYEGYPTTVPASIALTDTAMVTVGEEDGECREQTLFDQINCLIDALDANVEAAGLEPDLTENLRGKLALAKEKKEEAEGLCLEGKGDKARDKLAAAKKKIKNFLNVVKDQKGTKIPEATADDFTAKGGEIRDLIQELLDDDVPCALGAACLPDPPVAALRCELGKLMEEVLGAALDPKLTEKLLGKLSGAEDKLGEMEVACGEGNGKKALKKLKAAQKKVKAFAKQVKNKAKKGQIPQDVADVLLQHAQVIQDLMEQMKEDGACSGV